MISAALRAFGFMTLITGFVYPLLITAVGQIGFTKLANGSFIERDGKIIGSELIAQKFSNPRYFFARPSAVDYNPIPSGGSNSGPTSQELKSKVNERINQGMTADLLFASASGLDPHISLEAARAQVPRILSSLKVHGTQKILLTNKIEDIIARNIEARQLGFLGEPRVNVLRINIDLDELIKKEKI